MLCPSDFALNSGSMGSHNWICHVCFDSLKVVQLKYRMFLQGIIWCSRCFYWCPNVACVFFMQASGAFQYFTTFFLTFYNGNDLCCFRTDWNRSQTPDSTWFLSCDLSIWKEIFNLFSNWPITCCKLKIWPIRTSITFSISWLKKFYEQAFSFTSPHRRPLVICPSTLSQEIYSTLPLSKNKNKKII